MRWTDRLRSAVIGLTVAVASLGAGTINASLWPVTVQTQYYSAQVSLSPSWGDHSQIVAETVVGSISGDFAGLAPGIRVAPAVRPEITGLVNSGGLEVTSLEVSPSERTRVIREAGTGVALRFAVGALLGLAAVLVGLGLHRRALPSRRAVLGGALVTVLGCAGMGLSTQRTYHPDRLVALNSTGLLQMAIANRGLFADVEQRADQATPYLRNLLALSAAMQDEYAPAEPRTDALRLLLVSDIHAANQYALMRTIVQEQDIDAVIDAGDLINFGRVPEARLSNLYRSISSLGVPYIFVAGNHDRSSPTDTALLDDLAKTQGVVLLQPDAGTYQEVSVGGLRIAGFNDPRYYGDADDGSTDLQEKARDEWQQVFEDEELPDITVSHEAPAVKDAPGRIRLNGHGHVPALEGNRIQMGTFTGGGTLSHFVGDRDAELVGQASSFDVLSFDGQCQAHQLVRYQYRSIVEGRPTFDSLSVLNAERVAHEAQAGRTCGGDDVKIRTLSRPSD